MKGLMLAFILLGSHSVNAQSVPCASGFTWSPSLNCCAGGGVCTGAGMCYNGATWNGVLCICPNGNIGSAACSLPGAGVGSAAGATNHTSCVPNCAVIAPSGTLQLDSATGKCQCISGVWNASNSNCGTVPPTYTCICQDSLGTVSPAAGCYNVKVSIADPSDLPSVQHGPITATCSRDMTGSVCLNGTYNWSCTKN